MNALVMHHRPISGSKGTTPRSPVCSAGTLTFEDAPPRLASVAPQDAGGIMDFLNVVGSRRTIRWYKTWQPVATEKIQQILEVARLCTSPGNLQPWRAVVVWQDQLADDVREELLKAGNRQGGQVQAPVWIYWIADPTAISPQAFRTQLNQLLEVEAGPREYNFTEDIVERAIEGGEEAPEGMAPIHEFKNLPPEIAGAIAAQETNGACVMAVLAATDQGLGTALHMATRPSMVPRVKELLGVPEHCFPVWLQLVGYPAEDPNGGGQRPRRPFEELFFTERWGKTFKRDAEVVTRLEEKALLQPQGPALWRREEHRHLARMYGYDEIT